MASKKAVVKKTLVQDTRAIKELTLQERPRERLIEYGPETLSDEELLAILLRTGIKGCNVIELARAFLELLPGGLPGLRTTSAKDVTAFVRMAKLRGLGPDKMATLLAAQELGARMWNPKPSPRIPCCSPEAIANIMFAESTRYTSEGFWVLLLNQRNILIGNKPRKLTEGVANHTVIDPSKVFHLALLYEARAIILVHNHPSGDVTPSQADMVTTQTLIAAGKIMGVPVLDHMIIGRPDVVPSYYSLRAHKRCSF